MDGGLDLTEPLKHLSEQIEKLGGHTRFVTAFQIFLALCGAAIGTLTGWNTVTMANIEAKQRELRDTVNEFRTNPVLRPPCCMRLSIYSIPLTNCD